MEHIQATTQHNPSAQAQPPSLLRYVLAFLCVGIAWGFTTPFIRRASLQHEQRQRQSRKEAQQQQQQHEQGVAWRMYSAVLDLVRRPAYTLPLLVNLSGSALFFLIVGQAELSLTVPITNSLAFLFTVLGEWMAEGKAISRDTLVGMGLVLSGIAVCVHAKAGDA